ncbi:MAG: sel1 repeat family protein [Candidatus Saccharibacteria bacterium]|nr:sel1 repeat family protein [Rhodoferax sp.]
MKRLSIFSRQPDVVDVHDVRDIMQRPWSKSTRLWGLLAATLVAISAASWWTYSVYLKPSRDQRRVDEAVMLLEANPSMADWTRKMTDWPKERRLIELSSLLRNNETGIPVALGLQASLSALDLAIHGGSREARLELGKALRDGDFGDKDAKAAVSQFQIALEELQPGIKSGDQDSLYVYSLMLKDGLGIEPDPKKARELVKRVALSRDYVTMHKIGTSALWGKEEERDLELAKAISRRLIETGHTEWYSLGSLACSKEHEHAPGEYEQIVEMAKTGDHVALRPLLAKNVARIKQADRCRLQFLKPAAEKSDKDAIADLAMLNADAPPLAAPGRSIPTANWQPVDPEAQSRTGYLNGTKQIAKGGLSTFKVDNTRGGGDAVVRLYRDGKKPAARSMFVKNGESFTAEAVAPGAYRLRYRLIGSVDTFEVEETFTLSETPMENGSRFSRVTVTLYKVANGNMTVKKVDASEF